MSRADRFDRADFEVVGTPARSIIEAQAAPQAPVRAEAAPRWMWPMNPIHIVSLGDSVTGDRPQKHRPHEGLDIYAPPGTRIYAASGGTVLRVRDGRTSAQAKTRAAGLFVDVLTDPDASGVQYIQRYLHLGSVRSIDKKRLEQGSPMGELAQPHTSGLAAKSHLHFEVRAVREGGGYGPPLDPRRFFPPLKVT